MLFQFQNILGHSQKAIKTQHWWIFCILYFIVPNVTMSQRRSLWPLHPKKVHPRESSWTDNIILCTILRMVHNKHAYNGYPCAPLCTTAVGGAQRRSVVHNIVLYHWVSAQRSSHKSTWTDGQTDATKWLSWKTKSQKWLAKMENKIPSNIVLLCNQWDKWNNFLPENHGRITVFTIHQRTQWLHILAKLGFN